MKAQEFGKQTFELFLFPKRDKNETKRVRVWRISTDLLNKKMLKNTPPARIDFNNSDSPQKATIPHLGSPLRRLHLSHRQEIVPTGIHHIIIDTAAFTPIDINFSDINQVCQGAAP